MKIGITININITITFTRQRLIIGRSGSAVSCQQRLGSDRFTINSEGVKKTRRVIGFGMIKWDRFQFWFWFWF